MYGVINVTLYIGAARDCIPHFLILYIGQYGQQICYTHSQYKLSPGDTDKQYESSLSPGSVALNSGFSANRYFHVHHNAKFVSKF